MSSSYSQNAQDSDGWGAWRSGEPGARRKRLAGYLKAANELRQTYQQSYLQNFSARTGEDDEYGSVPGSYPRTAVRNGEEEMIIFPSYARRHTKSKPHTTARNHSRVPSSSSSIGEADFWRDQWDRHEEEKAIVDIDIRGWVYTPHRGPMTRKHRLFIGLARQLVGIPAPSTSSPGGSAEGSRASSPHGFRERFHAAEDRKEAEIIAREAEAIERKADQEARAADRGQYSERPSNDPEKINTASSSPSISSLDDRRESTASTLSWTDPAQMSPEELHTANKHLMSRLMPFLANPMASLPISAFFYNETQSRQRTIETDAAGHFSTRVALDFVPTHVRVLASEKLSVTEEIKVTEPTGVSVISDIDDTIKHSAITSGAREIFRNVFVREFRELSISGVKDWYKKLADRGVQFHYVSNSPWQIYPALVEFFSMAGLPPGSFHLKQYTGMFQGIFEPVAERKKATLEKIMRDFPERQFLLVGDSGEADLEVYRDVVKENPGRILGVFIRDVTTKYKRGFFNPSAGPLSEVRFRRTASGSSISALGTASPKMSPQMNPSDFNDPDMKEAIARSLQDLDLDRPDYRPRLPPRNEHMTTGGGEENLIDLDSPIDELPPALKRSQTDGIAEAAQTARVPPRRPSKPANLAGQPTESSRAPDDKTAPPLPRKPSTSILNSAQDGSTKKAAPPPPLPRRTTYRERIANAYNKLSPPSSPRLGARADRRKEVEALSLDTQHEVNHSNESSPRLGPRQQMSYPAMAGQAISNMYNAATGSNEEGGSMVYPWQETVLDKKEELWKRRWIQVKTYLDSKGVMLRAWRVGEDVSEDALKLVEKASRDIANGKHKVQK